MKVLTYKVDMLYITGAPSLDPLCVYIEDFKQGQGQITITCFGSAWTHYWPAMGEKMAQFFINADTDYLVRKLHDGVRQRDSKTNRLYLERVVEAVKKGLKEKELCLVS